MYTCPCARGLECKENSSLADGPKRKASKKHKGPKKPKKPKNGDMPHIKFEKNDDCPWLYKESKLVRDKKYWIAVCEPDEDQAGTNVIDLCVRPPAINTADPNEGDELTSTTSPADSTTNRIDLDSSCNLSECNDQSDCDEDECCLEVTRKKDKNRENHNNNATTFCFPHLDEDEVCDMNLNWSCPCREGLTCTEGDYKRKGKKKKDKDYSKYYRPTVTWKEGEECPTLYKKKTKKPDKYTPTCQEVLTRWPCGIPSVTTSS
jgi:hypothetical protein